MIGVAALPWRELAPCARVDLLQMLAGGKPAARIALPDSGEARSALVRWVCAMRWSAVDDGKYMCVSRDSAVARRVLAADTSPEAHEYELGRLLGYPRCCCAFVALHGEQRIDELDALVSTWEFSGEFNVCDPSGYGDGIALVSHIPCSPRCAPTRELALTALAWIERSLPAAPGRSEPWATWSTVRQVFGRQETAHGRRGALVRSRHALPQ